MLYQQQHVCRHSVDRSRNRAIDVSESKYRNRLVAMGNPLGQLEEC